jgi:hypothetical protein
MENGVGRQSMNGTRRATKRYGQAADGRPRPSCRGNAKVVGTYPSPFTLVYCLTVSQRQAAKTGWMTFTSWGEDGEEK